MNFVVTKNIINTDSPKDLDLAEPNESKFRLQTRKGKLILTYKTHLPKEDYKQWILQKGKSCRVWVAHENADPNNPYEHSHVLIMYDENMQTTNSRYFDYEDIHPNIKKIITKKHLLNVLKYMCKEDLSIKDDMTLLSQQHNMSLFEQVTECKTIQEVMQMAENPGDAIGLAKMYDFKPPRPIRVLPPKYPWQIDLDHELKSQPDDRKIVWYYDAVGKSGKTKFVKYERVTYPEDIAFATMFNGAANAACMIGNAMNRGWNGQAFLINLVRSAENEAIYKPIEMIKDGMMSATKYNSGELIFNEPHVVIFANFYPDTFSMSLDRWEIRIINKVEGIPRVTEVLHGDAARAADLEINGTDEPDPQTPLNELVDGLGGWDHGIAGSSTGGLANAIPKGKGKSRKY